MKALFLYISVIIGSFALNSCKIVNYSFTGASIPVNAKTFSVPDFGYSASFVQPDLGDLLTAELRDKMLNESGLSMTSNNGDLHFEGTVTQFLQSSQGVTSDERAAQNKLTVGVKVIFINKLDEKQNYEKTFSEYELYDIDEDFSQIEADLLEQIVERLVDKIFLAAVANW